MRRYLGLFLVFVLAASVGAFLLLSSSEVYPVELEANFSKPIEFRGAELLKVYPNEVTHVAIFRFSESPDGRTEWRLNETFELPVDYVVIELDDGAALYCRAGFLNGRFVFDGENCHKSLDEALRRNVTVTGCINATYLGHRLERNALLVFEFGASNETGCVNETVEVMGRLWGVLAVVKTGNGTVECPLQPVEGSYLENEVFRISHCP
ncbi:hypothetical protein [Thermococcus sp.]|uniref:hypothetical protein n=1 Tax=Thermococcus sp. TaxID=35749 RepID=UPI00260E0C37|nr:hypothetical protein [Thermococcus sp.]